MNKQIIKFHFFRSVFEWYDPRNIFAWIIRFRLNGYYNHVSIEIPHLKFHYQSRTGYGVTKEKTLHAKPQKTIELPFNNFKKADQYINWLNSQVGNGYDYKAIILGFFGSRKIQNSKRWFCSELANTYFIRYCGIAETNKNLVSPKDFLNRCLYFKKGGER